MVGAFGCGAGAGERVAVVHSFRLSLADVTDDFSVRHRSAPRREPAAR